MITTVVLAATLISSADLSGADVSAEPDPGGGTACGYTQGNVSVEDRGDYSAIVSNPDENSEWVNTIAGFTAWDPGETPDVLHYTTDVRLPVIPSADPSQYENGNASHIVLFWWPGSESSGVSYEAGLVWVLNPWDLNYGSLLAYSGPLNLVDTGIDLDPDEEWHTIQIKADFTELEWISVTVDEDEYDMSNVDLAYVSRPTWGETPGLIVTVESLSLWPFYFCSAGAYTFEVHARNLELSSL